ncbi:MAG: nicotinate (nicotinamide) nucleotide adenylyltransferase [Bacteroidetes bacterium]|nr:nicotinate (nicotinamide) nucleotide adenylyltransferase [Bacteroidota bacterium]
MRIGLFGGTFDPIHCGHLNLALAIAERHQLDRVVFCPAALSPFKEGHPPQAPLSDRAEMVRLAIQSIPYFDLWVNPAQKSGLSYTIDMLKDFIASHEEAREPSNIFLILGEDALSQFHLWKEVEEIVYLAPPLTGGRSAEKFFFKSPQLPFLEDLMRKGFTKIPLMEISSTEIRYRLKEQKPCLQWVPSIVLDYIRAHKLYS